ncbi:MAG: riboflavin biosynthesis protein RibF [Candidatus Omnitrophica bacterium]|nr:riboflavin biosynthesis protein RibF [Candidatus Omnitrophota bacterium]
MKVIYGTGRLDKIYPRVVAAIGVFDAIHRGHQKVIGRAVTEARRIKGTSVVITFYPHPVSILRPKQFFAYVVSLEHRLRLIKECGVDVCVVVPFTKRFAAMSAEGFVRNVLVKKLCVKKVIVGEDFCFGHDRAGSFDVLKGVSCFSSEKISIYNLNNINIKTKKIKELVLAGDLKLLKKFLGRDYSILSEVESGEAHGRRLGFPTANLKQENVVILPSGIYCVRAQFDDQERNGVFYIGTRPTFRKFQGKRVLELHVLDYQGNLYGKRILVKFLKKIRDDRCFSGEKDLVARIRQDIATARKFFQKILPR